MSDKDTKTRAGVKPALVSFEVLHEKAVQEKQDYYVDSSTGYLVMTSFFLKNRGYCCDNKCRHCPYKKKV